MASESGARPFVTSFQAKTNLTSYDFLKIFKQFDKDGTFFIPLRFLCVPYFAVQTIFNLYRALDPISPIKHTACFCSMVAGVFLLEIFSNLTVVMIFRPR